jgi:hypothetical protein
VTKLVFGMAIVASAILLAANFSPILAQGPATTPPPANNPSSPPGLSIRDSGPPLGVLVSHPEAAGHGGGGGGNLGYHGGPAITGANTAYAIFWGFTSANASAGYQRLVQQFFSDVSHDSTLSSDVYYSDGQYYGTGGAAIPDQSTSPIMIQDSNPFPNSGCSDTYTPSSSGGICISDAQIKAELVNLINNGINGVKLPGTNDANNIFFVFTPKNVGSCYSSNSCSYSNWCAYHSWSTLSNGTVIRYANMPYAAWSNTCNVSNQPKPNGDEVDYTINVLSHEHNEAITDPEGTAWFDARGQEDGDKCAWTFGSTTGAFNQTINGNHYYLQQEWSNKSSGCVLTGR